jgi:hypothetical protein
MKTALVAFVSALLAAGPSWAIDCASVGPPEVRSGYFPLICRGPLPFDMYQRNFRTEYYSVEVVMRFTRAPAGAGASGASLAARSCAWVDRPVNAGEPGEVGFIVSDSTAAEGGGNMPVVVWESLQTCLLDSNCRVAFCATNTDRRLFLIPVGGRFLSAAGRHVETLR